VRSAPDDLEPGRLLAAVAEGWCLAEPTIEYLPKGAGSHHWRLASADGGPRFVTVDDLDNKPWLGSKRDAVFDGLRRALRTAAALRDDAGLEFVIAPIAGRDGDLVRRLDDRYAVSVFPLLDGHSHSFGGHDDPWLRGRALEIIAALHQSTPAVRDVALQHVPSFGERAELESFLADPCRSWDGGPFSEPTRTILATRAADLARLVAGFDRLVDATAPSRAHPVITHGEPHPGNLMSVDGRVVLIDWDTVALGPPERDMSLIARSDGEDLDRYRELTGRTLDPAVITLYRLRWYLDDITSAVSMFRNPHRETADTRLFLKLLPANLAELSGWLDRLG
jgi:spectinomycin phosphotransferase